MLQPRASSPPSAKKSAWTVRTEAITRKAACGPRRTARIIPPPRCPLDPVPGIVKLIICAAKMKAPRTPIRGIVRSSICRLQPLRGIPGYRRRSRPQRRPHGGGEQGICHVHGRFSFLEHHFMITNIAAHQNLNAIPASSDQSVSAAVSPYFTPKSREKLSETS